MDKQKESCPWCQADVWVEPTRRHTYRCPFCSRNFNFVPGAVATAGGSAPQLAAAATPPGTAAAPIPTAALSPLPDFVETPFVQDLVARALAYLQDGMPVHLCGPAGGGKTTIALHLARQLGRPVVLIHGDDEMATSDLVGKESGFKRTYTRDQYIHTVLKVDEEARPVWVDKALADACRDGQTLVYDEFTRSRPEANNVLLSVLEEHILPLRGDTVPVHPAFRVIFTSNPADYAGVHGVQDALLDRMVTIRLDGLDRDTEVAIIRARSEAALAEAERIVDLVRAFRDAGLKTSVASVRPGILIARILKVRGGHAHASDPIFMQTCWDVLLSQARRAGLDPAQVQQAETALRGLIKQLCSAPLPGPRPRRSRQKQP